MKRVLLYDSESWALTETNLKKLHNKYLGRSSEGLRRICNIFWFEKVRNEDILPETEKGKIGKTIKR